MHRQAVGPLTLTLSPRRRRVFDTTGKGSRTSTGRDDRGIEFCDNLRRGEREQRCDRQSGFTLLEFLVAVTVVGFVLGLCGTAVRVVAASWQRSSEFSDRQDMVLRGAAAFRRDVERAQRIVVGNGADQRFVFEGDGESLSLAVAEPPFPTEPGLFLVRYLVSSQGSRQLLLRARQPLDPASWPASGALDASATEAPVAVFEGPFSYHFSYADSDGSGWQPGWPSARRMPAAIRLEIEHVATGTAVLPAIVVRTRINAEVGCVSPSQPTCTTHSKGELTPPPVAAKAPAPGPPNDRGR